VPTVIPLRQRPEFCAFFAQRFESEWPKWYGPGGQGSAREDIEAFANPEGNLPVGVVAIDEAGSPIGIAALKAESIASHRHLSPWVTAGYVLPGCRRAGVGAELLSALLAEARRLGFHTIYCATASAVTLLEREGWSQIDAVVHDGEKQFIFTRVAEVDALSGVRVKLPIKVVAGSSRNGIAGWLGDTLRVRVTAVAERGKANAAVEGLLREALGFSCGGVRIVSGSLSPRKIVEIVGLSEAEVRRKLSAAAAKQPVAADGEE
jgi:uncharacterized protein (TIGR00251 family)